MDNVTRRVFAAGAALAVLGLATGAAAQQTVKIGVIYPLSGNAASAGNYSKAAIEVGVDIINNGNAELAKICRSPRAAACRASAAPRSRSSSPTTRARRRPARTRRCA